MILSFINDFPDDRSIIQAKPETEPPLSFKHFAHSKVDFPVVITSSTIKIFLKLLGSKPLLIVN